MSRAATVWLNEGWEAGSGKFAEWAPIGTLHGQGVLAENITLTADRWGASVARFDLRRDPRRPWPDLRAFTPVEIEVDGVTVWSGRVQDTPTRDGERVLNVQAEGWQAHLDDHAVERYYVHSRLADWKDSRSNPGIVLNPWRAGMQVSNDLGQIVLTYPQGQAWQIGNNAVGVTLDLGPGQTAQAISLDWESSADTGGAVTVYARATPTLDPLVGPVTDAFAFLHSAGPNGTNTGTFGSPRRYVHVFLWHPAGGGGAYGADHWFRIKEVRVFGSSSYRSGSASALKASQVVADVSQVPELLSSDTSDIQTSSFSIPELAPRAGRTARELIAAANAYEDWQALVDVNRRVVYRPLPSVASLVAGSAPGFTFDDASANSAEEIYNAARIEAEQPDGTPLRFARTGPGGTMADQQGFTRSKTLPIRSTLTQAAAERIADKWLEGRSASPLKGKALVTGAGGVRGIGGEPIPPHLLLLRAGELLCLDHLIDPVTGAAGRDGRITSVTYTHAEDRAEIEIDNTRATFDALLARFDTIVSAR